MIYVFEKFGSVWCKDLTNDQIDLLKFLKDSNNLDTHLRFYPFPEEKLKI